MAKKKSTPQPCCEDEKWKIESDLRTIREAEAIKASPTRLKAVKALAKQEQAALAKVAGPNAAKKPTAKRGKK